MASRLYLTIINSVDRYVPKALRKWWESPAGPKTIFFYAPAFKWSLVIAGLSDLTRPVETISVSQNLALTATGLIWSRYSLVITPRNLSLFSVNFFVFLTGCFQLIRIFWANEEAKRVIS